MKTTTRCQSSFQPLRYMAAYGKTEKGRGTEWFELRQFRKIPSRHPTCQPSTVKSSRTKELRRTHAREEKHGKDEREIITGDKAAFFFPLLFTFLVFSMCLVRFFFIRSILPKRKEVKIVSEEKSQVNSSLLVVPVRTI